MVEKLKHSDSSEEVQGMDVSRMEQNMSSLDNERQQVMEDERRVGEMRRSMRGMEQGVKMFEKQLTRLEKQKIAVPADVKEKLAKIKAIIAAVKSAKTGDELDAAGMEDIPELMQDLQESQQTLEQLARWPQTIKQVNRMLVQLNKDLKRAKSSVDRLTKSGIDVMSTYTAFAEGVQKLQAARDKAVAEVAAGDAEAAFDTLESDVFGQMEDVMQGSRVIQTLSNFTRFPAEFKRGIAQAEKMINKVKRQKKDTAGLEDLLNQAKAKGQEVLDLMKSGDVDEEALSTALQELEDIKQEFQSQAEELTGTAKALPWEGGAKQFTAPTVSTDFGKLLQKEHDSAESEQQNP
jgi:chromosome segregation ATPase